MPNKCGIIEAISPAKAFIMYQKLTIVPDKLLGVYKVTNDNPLGEIHNSPKTKNK